MHVDTNASDPMLATVRSAPWFPGAVAPSYLTGELAGDVGFDPYGMVALAPTAASVDGPEWSGADRKAKMIMATDYEKHKKVMWMREAEMKHCRLAMMAAAGWPLSELLSSRRSSPARYGFPTWESEALEHPEPLSMAAPAGNSPPPWV